MAFSLLLAACLQEVQDIADPPHVQLEEEEAGPGAGAWAAEAGAGAAAARALGEGDELDDDVEYELVPQPEDEHPGAHACGTAGLARAQRRLAGVACVWLVGWPPFSVCWLWQV